jgi:sister-chromatid-cohesion protein PDS5
MDENEASIKKQLHNLIDWFAKQLPDPARATADLLKFAKMNDRRNYQLIRFCMAPESDYRIVYKAIVSWRSLPTVCNWLT